MPIASLRELGARIAEARKAARRTQEELGHEIGLDRTAVTKMENGSRGIDSLELSRIAVALRRPIDWFLSPPPARVVSRRAARDVEADSEADVQLELLGRDVEQLLDLGLLRLPETPGVRHPVRDLAGAERAAAAARKALRWPAAPIDDLLPFAEGLGLVAASIDLADPARDGSYLALEHGGVALVNGQAPAGRRRFTLAHELGHHVLADAYSAEWVVAAGGEKRERLINAFAIHLLMPRGAVGATWRKLGGPSRPREAAVILAAEFGVSWTAVCGHLRNLGLIDARRHAEILPLAPTKADFVDLELAVTDDLRPIALSPAFAAAVLRGYRQHKLSGARALAMLRGTFQPDELPAPNAVPLAGMRADLAPPGSETGSPG